MRRLTSLAFCLPALVGLLTLGGLTPAASASELTEARTALDARSAEALEALAGWCQKKRLFGKRDETYAALLEFDGEHAVARKKLRYTKGEDGAWVQHPKFKVGTNWNRKVLPEYEQRLAEVLDGHRAAELAIYAKASTIPDLLWARRELTAFAHRCPGDGRAPPLLRAATLGYYKAALDRGLVKELEETAAVLRSLYPEDVDIRTTLGETKHADQWVLLETARFLSDATGLDAVIKRTLRRMGRPEATEPDEAEAKMELPWQVGARAADVLVMGTADAKHMRDVAMKCQSLGPLFEAALGVEPERRAGLTLYLFAKKGEIDTFLESYPVVDNPSLRDRVKLRLDLVYLDAYAMALKANPAIGQLDLCVNTVLNQIFSDTFLDSADCRGWHAEGISRYLGFRLLGTRFSVNVVGDYAGQGSERDTPQSEADWLAKALALVEGKRSTGLRLILGKRVDAITGADATIAYAFAVYLIEGQAGLAAPFIRAVEKSADVDKACREILGAPLPVVEHRFRTWLRQVVKLRAEQRKKKK